MIAYMDLVVLLNFGVDYLLLLGTNRLVGCRGSHAGMLLAAGLGAVYGGLCMVPDFRFFGNTIWRIISLAGMAVLAFGWNGSALRRGTIFLFLAMALGGITTALNSREFWAILLAAAGVTVMCRVGFRGKALTQKYVPVTLRAGDKQLKLTALVDTGNTLKDPVTGQQVLVAGPDIAKTVTGLTPKELASPIETVSSGKYRGLRLIPYRAVGQSAGMLLAMSFDEVWIDGKQAGTIVAFAPESFGTAEAYQALAGGVL